MCGGHAQKAVNYRIYVFVFSHPHRFRPPPPPRPPLHSPAMLTVQTICVRQLTYMDMYMTLKYRCVREFDPWLALKIIFNDFGRVPATRHTEWLPHTSTFIEAKLEMWRAHIHLIFVVSSRSRCFASAARHPEAIHIHLSVAAMPRKNLKIHAPPLLLLLSDLSHFIICRRAHICHRARTPPLNSEQPPRHLSHTHTHTRKSMSLI